MQEAELYRGFSNSSLISDPLNLAKRARGKNCKFANFNMTDVPKTDTKRKIQKYFKFVVKMNLNL